MKNTHLRRCFHPVSLRRTFKYTSFIRISSALHLGIFDQPVKGAHFERYNKKLLYSFSNGGDQAGDDQDGHLLISGIGEFMIMADRDMDRISRANITDIILHLHPAMSCLDVIDFFHGILMARQDLSGLH
jgi:hypothetical protein